MKEITIYKEEIPSDGLWIARLIMAAGFAETSAEAKQLISRGRILVNKERIKSSACMRFSSEPVMLECMGMESVKIIVV